MRRQDPSFCDSSSDGWYLNPFARQSVEGERRPKGTGAECHYRGSYMCRHGQKHVCEEGLNERSSMVGKMFGKLSKGFSWHSYKSAS